MERCADLHWPGWMRRSPESAGGGIAIGPPRAPIKETSALPCSRFSRRRGSSGRQDFKVAGTSNGVTALRWTSRSPASPNRDHEVSVEGERRIMHIRAMARHSKCRPVWGGCTRMKSSRIHRQIREVLSPGASHREIVEKTGAKATSRMRTVRLLPLRVLQLQRADGIKSSCGTEVAKSMRKVARSWTSALCKLFGAEAVSSMFQNLRKSA